jgi:hypothetical protein
MKVLFILLFTSPAFADFLIIERDDGGISYSDIGALDASDEFAKWQESNPTPALRWTTVESLTLPDKYFRNAWYWDRGIKVDRSKAETIHRENLRRRAARRLREVPDAATEIEIKNAARIDLSESAAPTLEELKTIVPEVLR